MSEKTGTLRTTTILGSPAYMAPEQMQGAELTGAVDVWALAMLLWEMMTESKPWDGLYPDFVQLREAVCRGERVQIPPSSAATYPVGYIAVIKAGTSFTVFTAPPHTLRPVPGHPAAPYYPRSAPRAPGPSSLRSLNGVLPCGSVDYGAHTRRRPLALRSA